METDLLQNKSAKGSPWKVPSLNFCFLWMTGGNWMHPFERTWLFCEKPRFLSRFPAGNLFCFIISTPILSMKNKERRGGVKLRVAIIERVSDHVRMGVCACFPIFSHWITFNAQWILSKCKKQDRTTDYVKIWSNRNCIQGRLLFPNR